jgi:lysophospholipase L1-like esterase
LIFIGDKGFEPAGKIVTLNKMISEYAYTNAIPYVDYYSAMVDEQKGLKSIFSEDGVHPNKAGYEVMVPLAEKGIRLALK